MKLCLFKVAKLDACIRPLFANPVTLYLLFVLQVKDNVTASINKGDSVRLFFKHKMNILFVCYAISYSHLVRNSIIHLVSAWVLY